MKEKLQLHFLELLLGFYSKYYVKLSKIAFIVTSGDPYSILGKNLENTSPKLEIRTKQE